MKSLELDLLKYNRHWQKDFFYPYPKKRTAFAEILPYFKKKQIIEITGLRRVGKSTLIFQLINQLKKNNIDPYHLLYFTFDEAQPTIDILLRDYSLSTGLDYKKEKITLFLDEIQKLADFQNQIKVYYDLYPNIKFIISGSTSLFIRKKTQESLAGRIFSFIISPLSFIEYLLFIDKQELLLKPNLYRHELDHELKVFLYSQFIESIELKNMKDKKEYFISIVKKIIYEDLPSIFTFDNPHLLFKIVQQIAQKPGGLINNIGLSRELGISNKTVSLYLSFLEDSFLIKKYYNFSKNLISSEKRLKKYYLASPSFSSALVDFSDVGCLFENYLASNLVSSYFYRDVYGHEVDFVIIDKKNKFFPVEVKYKTEIKKEDINNLLLFMKKFSLNQGYVIYRGVKRQNINQNGKKITIIPFFETNFIY
ncbi:hypothetical protein A3C23_00460 [Candidatus Roizmanbacteria bacterium RIFCSPHIGHO2_02_FULL_37_13b]|uniref:AAA+ ATPase domain-containing protein n=1 Tax=Candidatus Roizmanbacteria bacterium RIFCSPLOWO2_02_FULL_36_11 TaxID=1802071 RepID=A0A1F7JBU6_9BACT|nr:MAG: hypothetical protein A3C23_00460 [Candidatus Roizmanbacteria bacterium RIFCSPHIGHO2_02_FULL_37_13b]OGK53060.1 MAG: hypothetical protein A3H78_00025 [Candidatus Roizmanbacteria bacterium RIFCSPLOWO2_02_FULL_36_11]